MKVRDIVGEVAGLEGAPYDSAIAKQHEQRKKKNERMRREKEQVKAAKEKLKKQKADVFRAASS